MKKYLFTSFVLAVLTVSVLRAQSLPAVAQALYDEAYAHDSAQVTFALSKGADILATGDGNSFYVQWFPVDSTAADSPLIVTLHGSSGYAFAEFYNWYSYAKAHGCGLIALQWYRGIDSLPPNDYFDDTTLYTYIDTALTRIGYPSHKAFLHGFSRGSARSYALAFLDSHWGKDYFCTILSNSGAAMSNYPLYAKIDSGVYGTSVFAGKQFALFCGWQDPDSAQSGCLGMDITNTWLIGEGASVSIFIKDDTLGHAGFHTVPLYIDSVLDYYTACFTSAASAVPQAQTGEGINVYPNPFNSAVQVAVSKSYISKCSFTVRNMLGEAVFTDTDNSHNGPFTKAIDLSMLPPGMYILEVRADEQREKRIIIKQ